MFVCFFVETGPVMVDGFSHVCWVVDVVSEAQLDGGFEFLIFTPNIGEMIQFDHIFLEILLVQPPTRQGKR